MHFYNFLVFLGFSDICVYVCSSAKAHVHEDGFFV